AGNGTAVLYSDDFGEAWTRLGSGDVYPCSTCDEAKVEEMPDGRVMLSVRVSGSRKFNVYTYTNSATAAGFWSNEAAYNSGTNACNGEHLLVPAKRVSDNANVFVCLMSLPQSGSRENVGFYYKEIADFSDYADGTAMAADWNRSLHVSTTTSCYSTMQQLEDGTIAFLYEENLLDGGYDIVFKEFTLEDLTDGLYTFNTGYEETAANRLPYLQSTFDGLPLRLVGTYVGSRKEEDILASSDVISAGTAYTTAPSQSALESYIGAVMSVPSISLHAGKPYRLYNKLYPAMTLSSNGSALTSATANTADMTQLFIVEDAGDGTWYLKNAINQDYAAQTGNRSTAMASSATPVAYKIVSNEKGETYLQCANPTDATYSAIHMNSSKNIVVWTPAYTSDASYWKMEPVDAWDWTLATPTNSDTAYGTAYLPFAVQLPANTDAYTISIDESFNVATPTLIEGGLVPAYTPVLLTQSEALTDVSFTVPDAASTVVPTTALVGTLKAITDYDADNTFVFSSDPNDSKVVG
ncbi:MAG: exo-alpha-sialidase, partial [Alloprevotella sp.]|nr:exo-alpha-sialidase [Alloprevotella sp.]